MEHLKPYYLRNRAEAIQLFFLALSAAAAWAVGYFQTGPDLITRLSFRLDDPSWTPEGFEAEPIIGQHFFGDFELLYAMGTMSNPYEHDLIMGYLPTAHLFLMLFTLIPYKIAFVIYIVASIGVLGYGSWLLASLEERPNKLEFVRAFLLFGILSSPLLVDLDRGNSNTLLLGVTAIFFGLGLRGNQRVALAFILFAGSFKIYYFIFAIAFIDKETWKSQTKIFLSFVLLNIVLMQIFTGNVFLGFKQMLSALVGFAGSSDANSMGIGLIAHSGSLVGSISRMMEFFGGREFALQTLTENIRLFQILSLAAVLLALLVWWQKTLPIWIRLFGLMSIIGVAQAGSQAYTWGWIGIAMIMFLFSNPGGNYNSRNWNRDGLIISLIAVVGLVPSWFILPSPSGDTRQIANFLVLSPLVVTWMMYVLFTSRKQKKLTR